MMPDRKPTLEYKSGKARRPGRWNPWEIAVYVGGFGLLAVLILYVSWRSWIWALNHIPT